MTVRSSERLRGENERLTAELAATRLRLEEAEQAIEAIRAGEVDSLVVDGPDGPRVFSLEGVDYAYRVLVEAMNEGAVTFSEDGTILYSNARFAAMLGMPLEGVIGGKIDRFVPPRSRETFEAMVCTVNGNESRGELDLLHFDGQLVPAYLSLSVLRADARRREDLCRRARRVAARLRGGGTGRDEPDRARSAPGSCSRTCTSCTPSAARSGASSTRSGATRSPSFATPKRRCSRRPPRCQKSCPVC